MSEQLNFEDEAIPITLRRAWDRALRLLATRVNKPTFEAHIRTLRPVSLIDDEVILGVPSAFTREWVEKRHAPLIKSLLEEILDRDLRLRFMLLPKDSPDKAGTAAAAAATPTPPAPVAAAQAAPVLDSETEESGLFQLTAETPEKLRPARSDTPPSGGQAAPAPPTRPRTTADPVLAAAPPRKSSDDSASLGGAPMLNPRYTFDSFVVGPSNRLAQAGAWAVAQAPGQRYNPLFLYGPPGLGKTHLMHAIGNTVAETQAAQGTSHRIAYISGESFLTHYVTSLRERRTEEFRRRWRSVDVLLVDDIQFIAGKEHTKEEFFHTFNALYQTGKQIVISSDRSPRELRMMDERLRSRFESGLIADIAPPELETRLAILQKKALTERMRIPDEVLLYMARLVQSNIRTLEGALVKLIAYASLENSPVTTQLAANILERYYIAAGGGGGAGTGEGGAAFPAPSAGAITPEAVRQVVARKFRLSPDALTGKKRDRDVAHARQVAMHLVRELTETSLPGIGQFFGGRDHSTVAHACDRIRSQIPFDDDLRTLVEELMEELKTETVN